MKRIFRSQTSVRAACLAATVACLASGGVARTSAQQKPAESAALEVIQIRPQFFVIAGAGSNVAVQLGPDGAVVVDTGSADKADQVVAEIRKLTNQPIRYVVNTSADPDHVGGNDKSLTDTDSLPLPDVLATEIADDLESALEMFTKIAARLSSGPKGDRSL